MFLGYNTNGLAHHELIDAIELIGEIGYRGVAITIDHHALSPRTGAADLGQVRETLTRLGLRSAIETGARYLLDPRRKHEPTLLTAESDGRARRVEFYRHAIRCAAELGSDCVSIWSGVLRDAIGREAALDRLAEGMGEVLEYAAERKVTIAIEPEPGMLIDTAASLEELLVRVDSPWLGVTLDVGHLVCSREPVLETIRRWGPRLVNVHIEDMRPGVHEHLMFGDGQVDFPLVLAAFSEARYSGGLHVELSRHSHEGPEAARHAYQYLTPLLEELKARHG
jgi:sugar phosphate isomerase/epimerase